MAGLQIPLEVETSRKKENLLSVLFLFHPFQATSIYPLIKYGFDFIRNAFIQVKY